MFKRAFCHLIIGGGCSGVAILSTSFSKFNEKPDALLTRAERKMPKIKTIKSYGDIEAYGLENGCVFRILEKGQNKNYSLADFLTNKKDEVYALEEFVTKLAEKSKLYCGKDTPVVTFSYTAIGKPPYVIGTFKIEKTPIK